MSQNNLDNNSNKSPERKKKMNEKNELNSPKKNHIPVLRQLLKIPEIKVMVPQKVKSMK